APPGLGAPTTSWGPAAAPTGSPWAQPWTAGGRPRPTGRTTHGTRARPTRRTALALRRRRRFPGGAAPPAVQPGPRRHTRLGRGGRPAVPRRVPLGARRLPRRLDVLHALGVPHHLAAARRAAGHR